MSDTTSQIYPATWSATAETCHARWPGGARVSCHRAQLQKRGGENNVLHGDDLGDLHHRDGHGADLQNRHMTLVWLSTARAWVCGRILPGIRQRKLPLRPSSSAWRCSAIPSFRWCVMATVAQTNTSWFVRGCQRARTATLTHDDGRRALRYGRLADGGLRYQASCRSGWNLPSRRRDTAFHHCVLWTCVGLGLTRRPFLHWSG